MTTMRGRAPLLLALLALLRHFFSVESVVGKGDDADDDYGATVEVDFDELLSGEFNTTQPEAFDPALIQPRIFGGRAVSSEVETYPYVVLLSQGGEIDCAGCLIGPRVVLTAGHCRGTDTVYVQDPEGSSTDGRPSFRRYNVRKEVRHPDYDSSGRAIDPCS